MLWLLATLLLLTAALALWAAPRVFWIIGAAGLVVSQWAIVASWGDARFCTLANVVEPAAVIYAAFAWGPFGLRAEYPQRASRAQDRQAAHRASVVTEADLAPLLVPGQRYLRFAGVVGQPRCGPSARASAGASAARPMHRGCRSRPSSTASSTHRGATSSCRPRAPACR